LFPLIEKNTQSSIIKNMKKCTFIFAFIFILGSGCSLSLVGSYTSGDAPPDESDESSQDFHLDSIDDGTVQDLPAGDEAWEPFSEAADETGEPSGEDYADAPEVQEEIVEEVPSCDPSDCPLGCNTALDRCYYIDPSNFDPYSFHDDVTSGATASSGETITVNTDDGSITGATIYRPSGYPGEARNGIYWNIFPQTAGPDIAVFGMASLTLSAGSAMEITGGHPAAFYVSGDVEIAGIMRARALRSSPGSGGCAGGLSNGANGAPCGVDSNGKGGGQAGSGGNQIEAGGGGGGAGGQGGNGADVSYSSYRASGGAGGQPIGHPELVPLSGGCGGGAGGGPDTYGNSGAGGNGGYGGGGGGAVQISAGGSITIRPGGGIDVAGAGGQGGLYGAGGGGGGSGGSILLEAVSIYNDGLLAANGGGGGAGGAHTEYPEAQAGWDGGFDTLQAPGGVGQSYGGNGGAGGGGAVANGVSAPASLNGGGGGGAVGRIRINYQDTVVAGITSPTSASVNHGVGLW
jgi:hypothetical protein